MFRLISRYKNDIVETDSERKRDDLLELGYTLDEPKKDIELKKMTVAQLEAFALEKGIDLTECKNKEEKLAKIQAVIGE